VMPMLQTSTFWSSMQSTRKRKIYFNCGSLIFYSHSRRLTAGFLDDFFRGPKKDERENNALLSVLVLLAVFIYQLSQVIINYLGPCSADCR
jgi:hypothetical protein